MTGYWRPDALAKLSDADICDLIRLASEEAFRRGEAVVVRAREGLLSEAERNAIRVGAEELARQALRGDAARRLAVSTVQAIAREEAEKAEREAREKAERERDAKVKATQLSWASRKGVALAVQAVLPDYDDLSVTAWESGSTRRVYLNWGRAELACFHVTGDGRHAPGTLSTGNRVKDRSNALRTILAAVAKRWARIKVDVAEAAAWDGEAIPLIAAPQALTVPEGKSP